MGEAKCRGRPPTEADRLPDFIFGRDKAAEEANGFTLAGKLVTDILRHKKPSEREISEIAEIIRILTGKVRRDPGLQDTYRQTPRHSRKGWRDPGTFEKSRPQSPRALGTGCQSWPPDRRHTDMGRDFKQIARSPQLPSIPRRLNVLAFTNAHQTELPLRNFVDTVRKGIDALQPRLVVRRHFADAIVFSVMIRDGRRVHKAAEGSIAQTAAEI